MSIPRPEYPRPDFERGEWLNLNGKWEFGFDDDNIGEVEKWYSSSEALPKTINVPFCYQTEKSGINDPSFHDVVWYRRSFDVPAAFGKKRVLLRFGAVDHIAKVWINGKVAGSHTGGYTPFDLDITDLVKKTGNTLAVRVEDNSRAIDQLRGKQAWKEENFGCWYTQVTGIWQTVWLEAVPEVYIQKVKMTPNLENNSLSCEVYLNKTPSGQTLAVDVSFGDTEIVSATFKAKKRVFSFELDVTSEAFEWRVHRWSLEHPNLYDIAFTLSGGMDGDDAVKSYFGMRSVSAKGPQVLLNNQPVYQRLILDQGYFDGGNLTAGSDADFIRDIELIKALGFNGLRKHQKVEDPRFLYWCDKMGVLVWAEMASAYEFNDTMIAANTIEWQRAIDRDYNHPSIIVWTLMNESWGIPMVAVDKRQQYHTISLYFMAKSYDPTRLVISNDGWEHTVSDILTFHDYMQDGEKLRVRLASKDSIVRDPVCSVGDSLGAKYLMAEGYNYNGQPIVFSECCGTSFADDTGWGYGSGAKNLEDYMARYRGFFRAIYSAGYLAGFCVTQLTDVMQEVNGMLNMKREPKVDLKAFSDIITGKAL